MRIALLVAVGRMLNYAHSHSIDEYRQEQRHSHQDFFVTRQNVENSQDYGLKETVHEGAESSLEDPIVAPTNEFSTIIYVCGL